MGAKVLFFSFLAAIMASTTQIHHLMPLWGTPGGGVSNTSAVYCDSWRLGVEMNNIRDWSFVPKTCADYVGKYMKSDQYGSDCDAVADEAIKYVDGLQLAEKDTWVFDIDETALSNLDYYAQDDVAFGAKERNRDTFYAWVKLAKVPALAASLKLYKHLISKKVKVVFLTGSSDAYKDAREENLKYVGYHTWEKLILKTIKDKDLHGPVFKSTKRKELEDAGYTIIGNIGDQWSDFSGTNVGNRTFKLPNPMYYI